MKSALAFVPFATGKAIVFFSLVLEGRGVCGSSEGFNHLKLSATRRIGLPEVFPLKSNLLGA